MSDLNNITIIGNLTADPVNRTTPGGHALAVFTIASNHTYKKGDEKVRQRSIGMMILLTIVTLGIYALYWYISFQMELKQQTGEGFGGLGHFLMSIITFGIYTIYWYYKVGERLEKQGGPNNGILYLILVLVGFGWLNMFLIQSEANKLNAPAQIRG